MIITLSIECLPHPFFNDDFQRIIEIDESTTLEEFHYYIQEIIDFENDHMHQFFIARNPYGKRTAIFSDEEIAFHDNVMSIDDTQLDGVFPLEPKLNLFYYFDFGDSWIFKIKRTRHKDKTAKNSIKYPMIVKSIGKTPVQYPDWSDE